MKIISKRSIFYIGLSLTLSTLVLLVLLLYFFRYSEVESTIELDGITVQSFGGNRFSKNIAIIATEYEKNYCETMGLNIENDFDKLNIIVFHNNSRMKEYINSRRREFPSDLDFFGTYLKNPSTICIHSNWHVLNSIYGILLHELTHYYNHKYFLALDPWLEEGIALLLGDKLGHLAPSVVFHGSLDNLKSDITIEFSELLDLQWWQFDDPGNIARNCYLSWSVVNYLFIKHGHDIGNRCKTYTNKKKYGPEWQVGSIVLFQNSFKVNINNMIEEIKHDNPLLKK